MSDKLTTEHLKAIKDTTCSNNLVSMVDEILEFRSGKQWLDMVTTPTELTFKIAPPSGYEFDEGLEFNTDLNGAFIAEDFYAKTWLEIKLKPTEPNPHAALIAQCEEDKRLYPYFYDDLYQFKSPDGWETLDKILNTHFLPQIEHRVHPHRDNIIAYRACSDADKLRWQFKYKGHDEWTYLWAAGLTAPPWDELMDYRMKPKVCQVTINGKVLEYPEPVRKPLEIGQKYWIVEILSGSIIEHEWNDYNCEQVWLKSGQIHLTEQAAKQHLFVLQAVNAQVAL